MERYLCPCPGRTPGIRCFPRQFIGLSLLGAALAPVPVPQVLAQEQPAALEEIIVTARRRAERDLDVPIAMSILDEDMLRKQNITELNDLGVQVPGLRMSNTTNSTNTPIISMRGQRPNDLAISIDQAVPIYFNEVVITPPEGSNLALYDLQSVQVLKGPQGTLFGRNSTGGALLITANQPGPEFGGYIEAGVGNYDLFELEGAVDLPVNDALQFRLAGRKAERDGYQDNLADNALGGSHAFWDEDSYGVRLTMNFAPGNRFSNLLTASYDENDMIGRGTVLEGYVASSFLAKNVLNPLYNQQGQIDATVERRSRGNKDNVELDIRPSDDVRVWFVSNISEYDLNDSLTFKSVLGYRDMELDQAQEADGSTLPLLGNLTSETELVTPNPPLYTVEGEQYSVELQLLGEAFDGDLEWVSGLYWFRMDGSKGGAISQTAGPVVDPSIFDPAFSPEAAFASIGGLDQFGVSQTDGFGDARNEAFGIFTEGTYTFSEAWSVTLGLRYSRDEREVTLENFQGTGREPGTPVPLGGFACAVTDDDNQPLPDDACSRTVDEDFDEPTWRASVNYTPSPDTLFYGSVSTGYRTGGFNMRGTNEASVKPFDEETVISYEVGHKTQWDSLPLRTNLALYYQDYENIQKTQQAASDLGFATVIVNAAEAPIYGAELDLTWAATDNLSLSVAYAYTRAEYDKWDDYTTIQTTEPFSFFQPGIVTLDGSDNDFTYIPEHTLTASANYLLPVSADLGDMSLFASVYWQDDMMTSQIKSNLDDVARLQGWTEDDLAIAKLDANLQADDYAVVNLRFDWMGALGSALDFSIYVDNATDEEYVIGGANIIDIVGLNIATYGPPRTYGASLRYSF
jgi:iron complex outermembrane receptor protein